MLKRLEEKVKIVDVVTRREHLFFVLESFFISF